MQEQEHWMAPEKNEAANRNADDDRPDEIKGADKACVASTDSTENGDVTARKTLYQKQKPPMKKTCPAVILGAIRRYVARRVAASTACRRICIALVLTVAALVSVLPSALWLMCGLVITPNAHHYVAMHKLHHHLDSGVTPEARGGVTATISTPA